MSSSPSLLALLFGSPNDKAPPLSPPVDGMTWYPLPGSRFGHIRKLLPSQVLDLTTGEVKPRRLTTDVDKELRYEDVLERLRTHFVTAIKNGSRGKSAVWVPLSAGWDSRLVLALSLDAGVPVKTYTMVKKNNWPLFRRRMPVTSTVSRADMVLPLKIAEAAGVSHRWIPKGRFSAERLRLYDEHTAGHTVENDRVYFTHGQWDWVEDDDVILRGGVFEVARCHYWGMLSSSQPTSDVDAEQIISRLHVKPGSVKARAVFEWADWVRQFPERDMDWRDRFYWEQRVAGWLSSLEQALDLVNGENLYIVNSQRILSLLLRIPPKLRCQGAHHRDLIGKIAPKLLDIPVNPPEPPLQRIAGRLRAATITPPSLLIAKIKRRLSLRRMGHDN